MSLVSRPIFSLGRPATAAVTFRRTGILYDYAVADIGLLAATSPDYPYTRETAPFRKDQFDNSSNPGEQTLTNWWLRSQSSWHFAAGIRFMEPANDDEVMNAFSDSVGINPWTAGQVTLLNSATRLQPSDTDTLVLGAVDDGVDMYLHAQADTLIRLTEAASNGITWGGTGRIQSLTSDGTRYYAADSTGVYRGTLTGGSGSLLWNTGNDNVTIGWAKQRLVGGIGPDVYELVGAGPSLPTPLYTHPSNSWRWTAITEGAAAILVAGYAGAESAIYKFVLDESGAMPTLTSGVLAATLPTGEVVHSMYAYLGAYIAIGTNKGVRIGIIDTNGDVTYGPLSIESTTPVYSLVGQDRFIYAGCSNQIDGDSGLWRIDLGQEKQDGRFAFATDLQAHTTGTVNSVSIFGASGRPVFGLSSSGSWLQDEDDLEVQGWYRTGNIRFNTIEPKRFRYVSARVSNSDGTVAISTVDRSGAESSVATVNSAAPQDYNLGRNSSEEYLALKFTLTQGSATEGPIMVSWQLKALPAITRNRNLQVPVLLFERMRDSKKAVLPPVDIDGIIGRLEAMENDASPVLFTRLGPVPRTELVVIEQVRFRQTSAPANAEGDGGILYLTLRTVQ